MSYGLPKDPGPKKAAGGSGCVFLAILVIGGFLIMSRMGGGGQAPPLDPIENTRDGATETNRNQGIDIGRGTREQNAGTTTADDWSIDDAGATPTVTPVIAGPAVPENNRTEDGDWSMEEVDTDNGVELRLKNPGSTSESTADGDWEMEEVDGTEKPKSTEEGDWKFEEDPEDGDG